MKLFILMSAVFTLSACSQQLSLPKEQKSENMSFNSVWTEVASDPLEILPQTKVSYLKLFSKGEDIILKDAQRTLSDHSDLLEPFEKLAHPNGICLKGIWKIDTPNIYAGYFKKGSEALMITRASSAMSNTKSGEVRSFGFAGKLFPTLNPNKVDTQHTGNFFLIDDLGGTKAAHYGDEELTNEPSISLNREALKHTFYALKVASTFSKVDQQSSIRQMYEISYLGEDKSQKNITPKWMKVEPVNSIKENVKDFRDELRIPEGKHLLFNIFVTSEVVDGKKNWQKIGTIVFDASVVSKSCDQRLHFHHPIWRDDIEYGESLLRK